MTQDNFEALKNMIYSGRGISVGMTPKGNPFIGYSLTGRSPPSQARELIEGKNPKTGTTTHTIRTNVTNKEELEKGSPALLLYPAFCTFEAMLMASNGAQTEQIYTAVRNNPDMRHNPSLILHEAFSEPVWRYDTKEDRWIDIATFEPDAPNNTPRIHACASAQWRCAAVGIIKCLGGERYPEVIPIELKPGKGSLITTYSGGNESPLASFAGKPLDVLIASETPEQIAEGIYAAIYGGAGHHDNYRVSAAVGLMDLETRSVSTAMINRSQRGE